MKDDANKNSNRLRLIAVEDDFQLSILLNLASKIEIVSRIDFSGLANEFVRILYFC
jgi:hypothetical protein